MVRWELGIVTCILFAFFAEPSSYTRRSLSGDSQWPSVATSLLREISTGHDGLKDTLEECFETFETKCFIKTVIFRCTYVVLIFKHVALLLTSVIAHSQAPVALSSNIARAQWHELDYYTSHTCQNCSGFYRSCPLNQVEAGPIFSGHWIPYLFFQTSPDIIRFSRCPDFSGHVRRPAQLLTRSLPYCSLRPFP